MTRFTTTQKSAKKAEKTQKTVRVKREVKASEMQQEQFLGLCMTCIHADGCAFRRDVAQAVLECDEFDIGQVAPQKEEVITHTRSNQPSPYKGLCVNCDIRQECKLDRQEEGVWHCEEYV